MRARCKATGHVAALPAEALELGMIPGWSAVDGPVPNGPKPAAFPEQYEANGGEQEAPPEDTDETADTESADEDKE